MKTAVLAVLSAAAISTTLLAGCSSLPIRLGALAILAPTQGTTAKGTVDFEQRGDKVLVVANISGLTPGVHGFHVHEKGDCSAPDASSAGGHFNPTGAPHGSPTAGPHHVGDMPMLVADDAGNAKLRVELASLALEGANSIIGKAVIVHAKADDFQTQPSGNSGARVACGVIGAKK